jgi:membrane protease YdiL (CAAX protease family)
MEIQAIAMVIKRLIHEAVQRIGVQQGGAGIGETKKSNILKDKPLKSFFLTVLLAPLIEEAGFRAQFSDAVKPCDNQIRWDIGVLSSALFSLIHVIGPKDNGTGLKFNKTLPLTQFLGGLFYWYFMRTRGVLHAMLAHVMNNAVFAGSNILTYRILPEKTAEKVNRVISG